jgi:hypothetical protein
MSEMVKKAEGSCLKIMALLSSKEFRNLSQEQIQNICRRIHEVYDVLVQNEGKLWLRTLDGRKLCSSIQEAASTLEKVATELSKSKDVTSITNLSNCLRRELTELERYVKKLVEEIKQRTVRIT